MSKNLCFMMMVGLPATGKSTTVKELRKSLDNVVVLNSDDYIEAVAEYLGITYSECFKDYYKEADLDIDRKLKDAIENGMNIIWDQTNITVKSRARKLAKIPDTYLKYCSEMMMPDRNEWIKRLDNRPGKTIPVHDLDNMEMIYEEPTIAEGFNHIFKVDAT